MNNDQDAFVAVGDIQLSLLAPIVDTAPEAVGEIAFSIAVDRSKLSRSGILDSIRPIMKAVATPEILLKAVAHEPDELSHEMPSVDSFTPANGEFTITFVRFPGESETDAYVVVADRVLHTRNVDRRPFEVFTRLD
jgi:hypothetical protein